MWRDADGELALSKRSLLGPLTRVTVIQTDTQAIEEVVRKALDSFDSCNQESCIRATLTALLGPLPKRGKAKGEK